MLKRKKNKSDKIHYSGAIRVFQVFATIMFVVMILFFTLTVTTSKRSLKSLCNTYIRDVELNKQYFTNYIDGGFTEEQTQAILTDDRIYDVMANVMSERMLALFRYTTEYKYSLDMCEETITEILNDYNTDGKVSDIKISSLTKYTCDISGITAMFVYDTPLAYRNALFNTAEVDGIRSDTQMLKGISTLSSWYFLLIITFMYAILLAILIFISNKKEKKAIHPIIANTAITPSVFLAGISFGEIIGIQEQSIVVDFVFRKLLMVSVIGIIVGTIAYFGTKKIFGKNIEEI